MMSVQCGFPGSAQQHRANPASRDTGEHNPDEYHDLNQRMSFQLPETTKNYRGEERRVGVEVEFAGIEAAQAAAAVSAVYGGTVEQANRFLAHVRGTSLGDFNVELDAQILHSDAYRDILGKLGIDIAGEELGERVEEILAKAAAKVVPLEVCSPPIPLSRLDSIEDLVVELRTAGALGTARSPLYAFGLQFNPEVTSLEPRYILSILQSFLVQFDDICRDRGIDLTRRLLPFVRSFDDDFRAFVCRPDYAPTIDVLIDDYLRFNPTRNRPLDLLPLFAFIDEKTVLGRAAEPTLIKPRPTFHYRLPDCHIDHPDWTVAREWHWWLRIEELAAQPARLRARMAAFAAR